MKLLYRSFFLTLLSFGLLTGGGMSEYAAAAQVYPPSGAYPAPYTGLRGLVDQSQGDLRAAADLAQGKHEQRERIQKAQGHLSTFDRHLIKGHFDKGQLDQAIRQIQSVLDHNVLQASNRDALLRDVQDLRGARERRY